MWCACLCVRAADFPFLEVFTGGLGKAYVLSSDFPIRWTRRSEYEQLSSRKWEGHVNHRVYFLLCETDHVIRDS